MASINRQWNYYGVPSSASYPSQPESITPEDIETEDYDLIGKAVEEYFNKKYPPFTPEIIHTFNKDYFLPALKVLRTRDNEFYSPSRSGKWVNMELQAECERYNNFMVANMKLLSDGSIGLEASYSPPPSHNSPDSSCDCGIYGSVNLEEIRAYIASEKEKSIMERAEKNIYSSTNNVFLSLPNGREISVSYALCIVEPSPDAEVILCRKGWRASHVFISEIVGHTISPDDASDLLSCAWRRTINVRNVWRYM